MALDRPAVVIHLAACVGVRPSIRRPHLYEQVNIAGTLNLLELCRQFHVEKFIFGSSSFRIWDPAQRKRRESDCSPSHLIDVLHTASLSQETLAQREVGDMERVDYPPPDQELHGATQAARCLEVLVDEGPYAAAA